MSGRRYGIVVAALALVCAAGLGLRLARGVSPTPEAAVTEAIHAFCEAVETRRVNDAAKLISPRFRGDDYTRRDIVQGLLTVNRDFERINIYLADVQVTAEPSGRRAEAVVKVAITGTMGGNDVSWGQREPLVVHATFEREGRAWRVVATQGLPTLGYGSGATPVDGDPGLGVEPVVEVEVAGIEPTPPPLVATPIPLHGLKGPEQLAPAL